MSFQARVKLPKQILQSSSKIFHPTSPDLHRPLRVLIDMDGVIANFEKDLLDTYRAENPKLPVLPDIKRRGLRIAEQYKNYFGTIEMKKLQDIMTRKGFFKNLTPISPAVEAVHKLLEQPQYYDCFICTAPLVHNPYCTSEKLEWIRSVFGQAFGKKVIITNDKTVVNGDFLVDDNAEIIGAQLPSYQHVLVRQSHNQHVKEINKGGRLLLEHWDELEDIMRINDPRYC
jgi:5'-nucleotidase